MKFLRFITEHRYSLFDTVCVATITHACLTDGWQWGWLMVPAVIVSAVLEVTLKTTQDIKK